MAPHSSPLTGSLWVGKSVISFLKRVEELSLLARANVENRVGKREETGTRPDPPIVRSGHKSLAGLHLLGIRFSQPVNIDSG